MEDSKDRIDEYRYRVKELNSKLIQLKVLQQENITKRVEYENLSEELYKLDNKIADVLNRDDIESKFRLNISLAFIILVAIVILGFYVIAMSKEEIAINIFSGEKGIQFITLFLIIIAIILFGIMGTLESRELSALLGALSGYILGKTSVPTESLSDKMAEYNAILLKKENNLKKGNDDEKN